MSGGFEYNLTTQSQYIQMKQKNNELSQENQTLKKTLEEMIKINNELSDTIDEFNNSALSNPQLMQSLRHRNSMNGKTPTNLDSTQYQKIIENLHEQVEYYKSLAQQRINGNQTQVIQALEGFVESFRQMQKYYEDKLSQFGQEIDKMKNQLQKRVLKVQQTYYQKTKHIQNVIIQLKKKQDIIAFIQKQFLSQNKSTKTQNQNNQKHISGQKQNNSANQGELQLMEGNNIDLEQIKQREKELNQKLSQKQNTIAVYETLLAKLRKKLSQKY